MKRRIAPSPRRSAGADVLHMESASGCGVVVDEDVFATDGQRHPFQPLSVTGSSGIRLPTAEQLRSRRLRYKVLG